MAAASLRADKSSNTSLIPFQNQESDLTPEMVELQKAVSQLLGLQLPNLHQIQAFIHAWSMPASPRQDLALFRGTSLLDSLLERELDSMDTGNAVQLWEPSSHTRPTQQQMFLDGVILLPNPRAGKGSPLMPVLVAVSVKDALALLGSLIEVDDSDESGFPQTIDGSDRVVVLPDDATDQADDTKSAKGDAFPSWSQWFDAMDSVQGYDDMFPVNGGSSDAQGAAHDDPDTGETSVSNGEHCDSGDDSDPDAGSETDEFGLYPLGE